MTRNSYPRQRSADATERAAFFAYDLVVREERARRRNARDLRRTLLICTVIVTAVIALAWVLR